MAGRVELYVNPTTVLLSPREGYDIPEKRDRKKIRTLDGTLYIYEYSNKEVFELDVSNVSAADAAYIITWWQDMTTIRFDALVDAGANDYVNVKIINDERPLRYMWPSWNNLFEGTLLIGEV